jgi:hypothetical protein
MRIVTEILAANVDLSPPPLDERAIDEVKAVLGLDPLALSDTVPARPALARQRAPLIQPPWSRAR